MSMKLNRLALTVLFLAACASLALSGPQTSKTRPTASDSTASISGTLGQPLGQVFRVTAILVENQGVKITLSHDEFRFRVTHIHGAALRKPVDIDFDIHPFGQDQFSIRPNVDDSKLRNQQLRLVASGKSFQFLAYETGSFHGAPTFPADLRATKSAQQIFKSADLAFQFLGRLIIFESFEE